MMSFAMAPPRPALTDVQIEQQKQFTSRVIQEKIFTVHLREFRKAGRACEASTREIPVVTKEQTAEHGEPRLRWVSTRNR